MDAAKRISLALHREAARVCSGIPEGRERKEAFDAWAAISAAALGYDIKTFRFWLDADHAPNLQAFFDMRDHFKQPFSRDVLGDDDAPATDPLDDAYDAIQRAQRQRDGGGA